ncbi:MAG: penicillin acylase family protein, partial [Candidatus Saccharicenans sp.]|jgi:penicillin amidase|nr:penicillin acylase family protein [Candidatus Saccharicenans sp.]MDH7492606.1 penicillin acylase family protein [Candidatus Saccharicenans sp.]
MKKYRFLRFILVAIFFLVLGAFLFFYITFRSSLPPKKDTSQIPGLRSEVVINWDKWGIPHLKANNELDLFLASGYIQARERLWQMELIRRIAHGRLAEILGQPGVKFDVRSRILGLQVGIERDYQKLSGEMKELLAAYARGVNTYMESLKWNWPPEFIVLRYRPEPWRIEDTLGVKHVLAMSLAADLTSEIPRMNIMKLTGRRGLEVLEPGIDFPPDPEVRLDYLNLGWMGQSVVMGSNNWVISGQLTETGLPFLANDPHLNISVPPIWMEIGLECPDYKVSGVTVPGVPMVIIGHNQYLAWGVTNSYVDVQDIYVEQVDWEKESYFRNGQWKPFSFRREEVKIRGRKDPQLMSVRWVEEGPMINPFLLSCEMPITLRWTLYEGDSTVAGLYLINKARNWEEFCRGARLFENPSQNFVYADVVGNIGYYLSGKIPVRKKETAVYPYPGWREDSQWSGYLAEEDKPNQFNPASGFIVTANNRISPDDYQHYLGYDWLSSDRKERIAELIAARPRHSVESLIAIQNDVYSRRAERVKKVLNQIRLSHPAAEEARKLLIQWSGQVREGLAPALFEVFWDRLQELTFSDDFRSYYPQIAEYFRAKEAGLERILDQPDSIWFDLKETEKVETREEIIEKALLEARDYLRHKFGRNQEKWDWARLHRLGYSHVLGKKWFLGFFNCGKFPMIGDLTTVRASFSDDGWETTGGASCRLIVDLSDLDKSLSVITSGQSGHFLSPHYKDQISLYLNSLYHPWAFSEAAVGRVLERTEKLVPQK